MLRRGSVCRLSALRAAAAHHRRLGTAHEKGIVHRDIKPANIFIAADGQGRIQPKVLVFGIAKLDRSHTSTRLTQIGAVRAVQSTCPQSKPRASRTSTRAPTFGPSESFCMS